MPSGAGAVGGFGGVKRGAPRKHVPVVFVHGNNVDAADWYPVRDDFRACRLERPGAVGAVLQRLGGSNGSALSRTNPERDEEHRAMGKDAATYVTENDATSPTCTRSCSWSGATPARRASCWSATPSA
jgi:hypothetical protein